MIANVGQRENTFDDLSSLQHTFDQVSADLHNANHYNLDTLIALNDELTTKLENCQGFTNFTNDEGSLDAELQTKLNPSTSATTNENSSVYSFSSSPSNNTNHHLSNSTQTQPVASASRPVESMLSSLASLRLQSEVPSPSPPRREQEFPLQTPSYYEPEDPPAATNSLSDLTNGDKANDIGYDDANHDEFDPGTTRRIQRANPIIIPAANDRFTATVASYNNQLLYNTVDRMTQEHRLIFIPDINNPKVTKTIPWNERSTMINSSEDEWIQDMTYSNVLGHYLLLNRSRLLALMESGNHECTLVDFHPFPDLTMKRLTCNEKFIFVTSSQTTAVNNGDEIILLNYQKEEQIRKTLRDILPSRLNRGAVPFVGEISDIATGNSEQVIVGYRFDRRKEIGVCLFNVTNDGRMWSCVKQLLLNECWHDNLSYTPRLDWSEQLKNFILVEYMTGHLIMIDRHGAVDGECRFMHAENRRESPINLAISNNGLICVRYESGITIHKLS